MQAPPAGNMGSPAPSENKGTPPRRQKQRQKWRRRVWQNMYGLPQVRPSKG